MTKIELMLFSDLLRKFVKQMMMQIGVYNNDELEKEFIADAVEYGKENVNNDRQLTMAALCIGAQLSNADLVSFGPKVEEEER